MIGVRGHALVEIAWGKRCDKGDNLPEIKAECRGSSERRNCGADFAGREQGLHNCQPAVRRLLLHETRLPLVVIFGK
jgi:hypothetical protein